MTERSNSRTRKKSLLVAPRPHATTPYHDEASLLTPHSTTDAGSAFFGDDFLEPSDETYKQTLRIDDDLYVDLCGYRHVPWKQSLYYLACILTGGLLYLLCRWSPRLYLLFNCELTSFQFATLIYAHNSWNQLEIVDIQRKMYGSSLTNVFAALTSFTRSHSPGGELSMSGGGSLSDLVYFQYHYMTFVFNPFTGLFVENTAWKPPANYRDGLSQSQYAERATFFGPNSIEIPQKSTLRLMVDEILHPFFIFQIFSIILWILEHYYYYAACILLISAISIAISLNDTKRNYARLRKMTEFHSMVAVYRSGIWKTVPADELVPGDIYEVAPDMPTIPADSILLTGDCIINEGMLSGESVPVIKTPVTPDELELMDETIEIDAKHYLFRGTHVIRMRPHVDISGKITPATAVVVRTAFNTTKGSLIRSIMFPKPNSFQLYQDSFRFLRVLGFIALIGFIWTIVHFIQEKVHWKFIVIRSLDLVTIVVPPALPAAMSIGTTFAIQRLKKYGIFCISPPRVNVCGKLNLIVFDKTGTLTEDGLDVYGVRPSGDDHQSLLELMEQEAYTAFAGNNKHDVKPVISEALATCHSLKSIDGHLVGDPLDWKMFEFSQWELEEPGGLGKTFPTIVRPKGTRALDLSLFFDATGEKQQDEQIATQEVAIVRLFEFVPSLRRMSVMIRRLSNNSMKIYTKGAPEVIKQICRPETLPDEFDAVLHEYSSEGFRVIALAGKVMHDLSWLKSQKLERTVVEQDLTFLGFIAFENRLKKETKPVLDSLAEAKIRDVMCTGDNLLTAVCVARECGLISAEGLVFAPCLRQNEEGENRIVWECLDNDELFLNPKTLVPMLNASYGAPQSGQSNKSSRSHYERTGHVPLRSGNTFWKSWFRKSVSGGANEEDRENFAGLSDAEAGFIQDSEPAIEYDLAVTGEMFTYLLKHLDPETAHRMLVKAEVYARMSPDQKLELIERLQELGYCVGMVGDGANDCSALKAADVGISLSEAEASVAAPFTSSQQNIGCVLQVMREGRAALVTSFNCFKYIALYSMIQFISVSLLYTMETTLGDFQFLYIDLFLILPIAVFMGRTQPADKIHPKRPTASLVSKKVLVSLVGQIVIELLFQLFVFMHVRLQPWFIPRAEERASDDIPCYENTVLYLLSCFQYITIAVVFSVGPPYRKRMATNVPFVMTVVILMCLSTYFALIPDPFSTRVFELMTIPLSYRFFILMLAGINFLVSYGAEKFIFPLLSRCIRVAFYVNAENLSNTSENWLNDIGRGKWRRLRRVRKPFKIIQEQLIHEQ